MVIEERGLVYPEKADKNLKEIYYKYYSISSIRKISELIYLSNRGFNNLWIQLKNTFLLFENEHSGKALGLKPLAGDLFGERAIELLRNRDLENKYLLDCLNNLNFYSNDKGQKFRVNYAALSVEEFGSVYEGLLEYKPVIQKANGKYEYSFGRGDERSKSGSHYTPDELVQPLIKHSLDYIIEDRLKEKDKEKALLSITVLDISCGSGHILLNAARRIAIELAKSRSGEDQPNPSEYRKALKDVIKNCIYGVDKNPLAVELCKVALWLESHNPGEPLNFLDHKIKCGDSIVGLAHKEELEKGIPTEAFKTLPGDDKEVATELRKINNSEIKARERNQITIKFKEEIDKEINNISGQLNEIVSLPESTPEEVEIKKKKYLELNSDRDWYRLKNLSDIQVAQFFIPKTIENKNKIITDSDYFEYLYNEKQLIGKRVAEAMSVAQKMKFFHWFLEFPEVFQKGGFDCVISNPPFLGGQKLSGTFGDNYLEYIKYEFVPIGAVDLVTYFFRRIFAIINEKGFQSLISTNTIAQRKVREYGLDIIVKKGGVINHAVKSLKWPGKAAVEVSLVTITRQKWKGDLILGGKEVKNITPYLDDAEIVGNPFYLKQNEGISFQGSIILGIGFVIEPDLVKLLIERNLKNKEVLFPYLNGNTLNNNWNQITSKWVINFFDWEEDYCRLNYPDCFDIVEKLVKPERIKVNREVRKKYWWRFGDRQPKLYKSIASLNQVIVITKTTKYFNFIFFDNNSVFDQTVTIIASQEYYDFVILNSIIHECWSRKLANVLGGTYQYSPSDCFETFPFIKLNHLIKDNFAKVALLLIESRNKLLSSCKVGLTNIYNLYHSLEVTFDNKQLSSLNLELSKNQILEELKRLRETHIQLDKAVLVAYGWQDIELKHDFYEVDYLPENDRVRFTIHPDARREILKRLLELNHKIHQEEVKAGLWEKKKVKSKKKADVVREPEAGYGLFDKIKKGES